VTSKRAFWAVVILLVTLMAAIEVTSALQENQTFDEGTHLAAGFVYLKTGVFLNVEHPPLMKILAAYAVWPLHPTLSTEGPAWNPLDEFAIGSDFLYKNRVPAERLLFAGRMVTILFSLVLALTVAVWTRAHFGPAAALLALFLFTFDPNLIAHGRYITNDLHITLLVFLACVTWGAYLQNGRWRNLFLAGAFLAAAVTTKFSAVILFPVFLALYGIAWWQRPRDFSLGRVAKILLVVIVCCMAMLAIGYAPLTSGPAPARMFTLPVAMWADGFGRLLEHNHSGQSSYLLGKISSHGWWYFFPVVFAVKTPTAVLFLTLFCLGLFCIGLAARRFSLQSLRSLPLKWFVLFVPMAAYFLACMCSNINLGVRHLLPIYPFLFVLLSAILMQTPGHVVRMVICVAIVLEAVESLRIYPNYLAFFNTPSGGPANGASYLVDSNLDWGQDLKKLRTWWDGHGHPPLGLVYFGGADRAYFGLPPNELPASWDKSSIENADCIAAISATLLKDVYVRPGSYQWLRELRPMGTVGYSIYLFDLRKKR